MYLLNLHTTPKRHLINYRKTIFIEKNIRPHDVLNGLKSIKFLEILSSNKTSNIFSTYQLKITFKPLNFVREPFLICLKIRTPLGLNIYVHTHKSTKTNCLADATLSFTHLGDQATDRLCLIIHVYNYRRF